jgi:hypothetical protein
MPRALSTYPDRAPVWLLGPLLALAVWKVGMGPPRIGIDSSWNAGLAMAVHEGLQFGRDAVFSYGPLGFLRVPTVWFTGLVVPSFLYVSVLFVAVCTGLVWALRRAIPTPAALLVAFLLLAIMPGFEQTLLLVALVSIALLERERPERAVNAFVVLGAIYAAIELLIKFSTGPFVLLFFLLVLIGIRARRVQIAAFLAIYAAALLLLWLAAGQNLGDAPALLERSLEVASGYSSAMIREVEVPAWQVPAAAVTAGIASLALVYAVSRGTFRDRRARVVAILVIALISFSIFKEGTVRADKGHLALCFSTLCLLWIALPWTRARWPWMLAGAAALFACTFPVRPDGQQNNLNPVANLRLAGEQVGNLLSGSRRKQLEEEGREGMVAGYALDPRALAELEGHRVNVEPWEVGVAWAYRLDWSPVPVFQNYSAYTQGLDEMNARRIESPDGPDRILRENEPLVYAESPTTDVDRRFPGWDPPEQARAVLCNFAPLYTDERWQVLGRVGQRCGPARPAGSVRAGEGEAVSVPAPGPGEAVFVRIHGAQVEGLEHLLSLLYHPPTRRLIVNGATGYRLVPETAADGLLLRGDGPPEEVEGPFAPMPQARTIALTGAGGGVEYDFFRMRVRGWPAQPPSRPTP